MRKSVWKERIVDHRVRHQATHISRGHWVADVITTVVLVRRKDPRTRFRCARDARNAADVEAKRERRRARV
jgi:hypothetical protein